VRENVTYTVKWRQRGVIYKDANKFSFRQGVRECHLGAFIAVVVEDAEVGSVRVERDYR
jgi:hypothetical protein